MKTRLFTVLIILAIGLAGATRPAQAQAYNTSFTTGITYQNVGNAATTTLQILFYDSPSQTTPIQITQPALAAGAGTAVFIGGLSQITLGFRGSAVMQADQKLLATLVQVPNEAFGVKNRPISNGFDTGASTSLIATVLKGSSDTNTIFSVQNVDSEPVNINIKYINSSNAHVDLEENFTNVQPGASKYRDAGTDLTTLASGFSGSAVITAVRTTGGSPGLIVSSAMELEVSHRGAKAFEGVSEGAQTIYMPTALCNFPISAGKLTNSAYAIQNTSLTTATNVTVTYLDKYSPATYTETKTVGPGAKGVFFACQASSNTVPAGFVGSAVVVSTATDVVAVGKVYGSGMSTGFVGIPAGGGFEKVALPYVRWADAAAYAAGTSGTLAQRVYIAIQNIGSDFAGDITVVYKNCDGTTAGAPHVITGGLKASAKANSDPTQAGLTVFGKCPPPNGSGFGGSALITGPAGSQLAVIARVQTQDPAHNETVAEDYNGINVP